MTDQTAPGPVTGGPSGEGACWCSGQLLSEPDVLRLGEHPEAAVCLGCAHFLHQRARAREDEARPSPAARGAGRPTGGAGPGGPAWVAEPAGDRPAVAPTGHLASLSRARRGLRPSSPDATPR